jgi:uncharacterized protein (UPF0261 family)
MKLTALIAGTFDTKGAELGFLRDRIASLGLETVTVDLSTSGLPSTADVPPEEVARHHPAGAVAVFTGDRGRSMAEMAIAFGAFVQAQGEIGGLISAGGSGGTTLATAGMRKLPVGVPKIMVSTVASGQVAPYVGASDIMMMYSVADVQGLNAITSAVLGNAAHALAGMIINRTNAMADITGVGARPAIGFTMFGVTTPVVQALQKALARDHECLVFHATGTGGRSMENLVDSGLLAGLLDLTTTEIADLLVGGIMPATEDRFGAVIRTSVPYVGSVGALDMVNFGALATVPERFRNRKLHGHNPNVTLMRTNPEENRAFGHWIANRLNKMQGPVRFLLPTGGVSLLDQPGQPFHDPEANAALFEAIESHFKPTPNRKLIPVAGNINDAVFVEAALAAFRAIMPKS